MEAVMMFLILAGAALLVIYGIATWRRKRREAQIDKEYAEMQAKPISRGFPRPIHTRAEATNYPQTGTAYPPSQPTTVVHHDSGINPLLAGAVGYMIGSSMANSHASERREAPATIGSCPAERDPEPSYESSSSSDSGSSDSSSSYDSGSSSSSDSGGSSGGGGGD